MSIWRVSIATGGLVALSLLVYFGYQILVLDNVVMLVGLERRFGYPYLATAGVIAFAFMFIVALITFPYYWFKSLPLAFGWTRVLMEGKSMESLVDKNVLFGLLASTLLLVLVLGAGLYVAKYA